MDIEGRVVLFAQGLLIAVGSFPCHAQVTLDGSLGPTSGAIPPGPSNEIEIREDMGRTVGSNLFHSFGEFSVGMGETASFTGASSIENILSRVTGGNTSNIDGTLRTDFVNSTPNLFLLNPAGVIFGPNASLDVQGSFHVSTADFLRLEDGIRFSSVPMPGDQVLTTAPPEAFGFLRENPESIAVLGGSGSLLEVPRGETLSLIGGEISIDDSALFAPGGRVNLVSAASSGEVMFSTLGIDMISFERLGEIRVSNDPLTPRVSIGPNEIAADIDVSDETSGDVFIRGGQLVMDKSFIASDTENGDGGGIDIGLTGDLKITGDPESAGLASTALAGIRSRTTGDGNAGDILLVSSGLELTDGADIISESGSFVVDTENNFILQAGLGNAGNIRIGTVEEMELSAFSKISSASIFLGNAGNIELRSNSLAVNGGSFISSDAGPSSAANAGTISIQTGDVRLLNGGQISSTSGGFGAVGDINLAADNLTISGGIVVPEGFPLPDGSVAFGFFSGILSNLQGQGSIGASANVAISVDDTITVRDGGVLSGLTFGAGNASNFLIGARQLRLESGGLISTNTSNLGAAGLISVAASESVSISGELDLGKFAGFSPRVSDRSGISSASAELANMPSELGAGGTVFISARDITVENGGEISTTAEGAGPAGPVLIGNRLDPERGFLANGAVKNFHVDNGTIKANTSGSGLSSGIFINAENVSLVNGAQVTAETSGLGAGGLILVGGETGPQGGFFGSGAVKTLRVDNSSIRAGASGSGRSGGILINAENMSFVNETTIAAETTGVGQGGLVALGIDANILAGEFIGAASNGLIKSLLVDNSSITAETSGSADAGFLLVNAENIMFANGAEVTSQTSGAGSPGGIFMGVDFEQGSATGNSTVKTIGIDNSFIGVETSGSGQGGAMLINAEEIDLLNNSIISSETSGAGNGGGILFGADVDLQDGFLANDIVKTVDVDNATISAGTSGQGRGGAILVNAEETVLVNGAKISNESSGTGNGGAIAFGVDFDNRQRRVVANGAVKSIRVENASITAEASGSGDGGNISIGASLDQVDTFVAKDVENVDSIYINDGGSIRATSLGAGKGGRIFLSANSIDLNNESAISSTSSGDGNAGEIRILNTNNFRSNGSEVTTEASQADGGDIEFQVKNLIELDDSSISTSVSEGGTGGNIDIDPRFVILDNSDIVARAGAGGTGGNIGIVSDFIFRSPDSVVSASAGPAGIDGTVDIDSPDTNISGSIAVLPETYINAADRLSERCGARTANLYSFVVKGRGGIPRAPGDLTPARASSVLDASQSAKPESDLGIIPVTQDTQSNKSMLSGIGCVR